MRSNIQLTSRSRAAALASAAVLSVVALAACKKEEQKPAPAAAPIKVEAPKTTVDSAKLSMFQALPKEFVNEKNPITPAKVELGRKLYWDARLSRNHDVSCNTCHLLDKFGVDGTAVSEGHKKQRGPRNSPSVYNSAGQFAQFWDGRAEDVEAQSRGPVVNPVEMAMADEAELVALLKSIPGYVDEFKAVFPDSKDAVTADNFGMAVGAFERTLVTPSKWDKFLGGDQDALTEEEKKGFLKFSEAGCPTCHSGPLLGGATFQKLGLVKPWPAPKEGEKGDEGRAEVTKQAADKLFFKVPQLRNVTQTAPYFHNGAVGSLEEAIKLMGEYQVGKQLSDEDVAQIVTFLHTLEGEPTAAMMQKPELPASGPSTPKPRAD